MKTLQAIVITFATAGGLLVSLANDAPVQCHAISTTTNIPMGSALIVVLHIENITDHPITLDFTPDEVLHPRTEEHGGSYRLRGSHYTASISQDTRYRGFITIGSKLGRDHDSSVTIQPGDDYRETISMPTDSRVWLSSGPLIPGPAKVIVRPQLVIGTNTYYMECSTGPIFLERRGAGAQQTKDSFRLRSGR